MLFVLGLLLWNQPGPSIKVAVGKGGRLMDTMTALEGNVDQALIRDLVMEDSDVASQLSGNDVGYLYATALNTVAARTLQEHGCLTDGCFQASFYDYSVGGTFEGIVNVATGEVIDFWRSPATRPGASPFVIPRALAIAADDEQVTELLGDIRSVEPMMVPMSTWLADDDCNENWCVDLTFAAPDGSGRVLHVFVNMEQDRVARVFYTRGRPDREFKRPAAQGPFFNDGCHEQYGWSVCWEMTAHDGIEFFDAVYQETPIFSSAKIGQVEAYYPSWPGGYRDEIGYASSVPPHYGTHIIELEDGFEVRQLYTEFLRWPNCICCYRYEQIIRFYADGSFEPSFVSHGPGCDDPSQYRPFWRIAMNVGDTKNEETWFWQMDRWVEAQMEIDLSVFGDLSPDGSKLHTVTGDKRFNWQPKATDPLGQDEARLIVIRLNEGEGEGPIATGPADTYQPPRQWVNDEPIGNENIVVWYIPTLKTRKGEPWWCMPDPEPDFSPCEAPLLIKATGELIQPTPQPTPVESPTASATPMATNTPAPTLTPRPVAGEDAKTIILNSGCGSCHAIGSLGEAHKVGPDLSTIGAEAANRVPGLTAAEYLRQSILEPGAFVQPNCPNGPCRDGIMPRDYTQRLTPEQIDTIVSFLLELTQDTSGELAVDTADPGAEEAEGRTSTPVVAPSVERSEESEKDTLALVIGLTVMTILFLVLWLVLRERRST